MDMLKNIVLLGLLSLLMAVPAAAGEYKGVLPGESCRGDVYKAFGQPIYIKPGEKLCKFDPKPHGGKSVVVEFYDTGIVNNIMLEPGEAYSAQQYEEWMELGKPDGRASTGKKRISLYPSKGIGLVHDGDSYDDPVIKFMHYSPKGQAQYRRCSGLEDRFHKALKAGNCKEMKSVWQQGQKEYPNVSWFYIDEISWMTKCADYRNNKQYLVNLAEHGAALNPTEESYKFLGFVHVSITDDPARALEAFERIDLKNYPNLHVYVGGCHMELGNKSKARKHFQAYLDEFPNGKLAKTARSALRKLK